jgi:hypothetical protein
LIRSSSAYLPQIDDEKQKKKMNADPKAWIEIVRDCNYLPEPDLKKLCEMVRVD